MTMDFVAVLRKELLEVLGERRSRQGSAVQAAIVIAFLGVVGPVRRGSVETSPEFSAIFIMVAAALATTVAADAVAGERERRTLETLLATPISEDAVLFAKVAASVIYGASVNLVALSVSMMVGGYCHPETPRRWGLVFGLGLAICASCMLMSAVAVIVSMIIPVARSAQQICSFITVGLTGALLALWIKLDLPLTGRSLFVASLVLFGVSALVLTAAASWFRRDRLFGRDS